ncbi:response regulator [Citreicella sp. C3M06]|uniref:sensor histidine kinase n=1 Tax=Citreicella sp. C3M06 TaxID=2841564 RepID=UPI001C0984A0|nr:ATP-binding protein [Citreicella sp. C3M06]MBU2961127.1 response regulator [Citreicella sp. C3M06]
MVDRADVLIIDDDDVDRRHFRRILRKAHPTAKVVESAGELDTVIGLETEPHIAFIDYRLPRLNGIEMMEEVLRKWPCTACIIVTGQGDEEIAKTTIKKGAFDYIQKSRLTELPMKRIVENALAWRAMQSRIEEQKRELELFADVLLHDLKAPVRSIQFFVGEIETEIDADVLKTVDTEMRLLRRSARQISSLLDSLGSHIRASRAQEFEKTALRGAFDEALLSLDRTIAEVHAKITLDVQDSSLFGSAPQLAQLFQNLIANAMKYSGGKTPEVRITSTLSGADEIRVTIADKGIGIAQEHLERIFEPFKRIAPQGEVAGTGLGLATCRKIVERHGGKIWCESEPGVGSRFCVTLPCHMSPEHVPSERIEAL